MGMYGVWAKGLETGYRRPALAFSQATALNPLSEISALLLIVVVIIGSVTHEPLVTTLGALAFVVTMASRIWAALSLREITIDRSTSIDHAFQDDEITITFTIRNNKPLPVSWLEINEYVPRGLLVEGHKPVDQTYLGGAEISVSTSLGSYEQVKITRKLRALSRGTYRLGKTGLRSGDLFGLYPVEASLAHTPWSIFVYPKIKELSGFSLPSRRPIGDSLSRRIVWSDPSRPAGVREYQPGDPVKNIDWKTTARRGEMYVRKFDSSMSEHVMIFAEAVTTKVPWEGYRSDVLEGTMVATASISKCALELGYKVGLVTNGITSLRTSRAVIPPSSGPNQLTSLLEALAMVQPIAIRSTQELVKTRRGAVPIGCTLMHIGGIYQPRTMHYLAGLARIGHPVIIVHVGREDPPEYPEFEVRDARELFLPSHHLPLPARNGADDFGRPTEIKGDWNAVPISTETSGIGR